MRVCPICGSAGAEPMDTGEKRFVLLRCHACGAGYVERTPASRWAHEHYRDYYARNAVDHDPLTERRYHAILSRIERLTPRGRLLDIGCGAGHFLVVAEGRGWTTTGIEVSESALALLAGMKTARRLSFSVVGADLDAAGFEAATFDAVTLFEVIEHVADPPAMLREIHRIVKPGGVLYLTTPNLDGLPRYLLGPRWRAIDQEHVCLFTTRALRRCLDGTGFRPIRVVTKNVELSEIRALWRRRPAVRAERAVAARRLRHRVEASPWLRGIKTAANAALRLSGLGETIEVLAARRPDARAETAA